MRTAIGGKPMTVQEMQILETLAPTIVSEKARTWPAGWKEKLAELHRSPPEITNLSADLPSGGHLVADRAAMQQFVDTVFRNCVDLTGWVALRAFPHDAKDGGRPATSWTSFGTDAVAKAADLATAVARREFARRAVFAPPVCLFSSTDNATEGNVAAAPAIAVELDERPDDSRATLVRFLGQPTMIVASGGLWTAPDGKLQEKLHLYWRLREPAVSTEAQAMLRSARRAATVLVGGDASAVPLSHPMRWPGSWHTKQPDARICRIIGGDPDRNVELVCAVAALEAASEAAGLAVAPSRDVTRHDRIGFKTATEWTREQLTDAVQLIPNTELPYDEWNRIGMAMWDASHGSVDGLEAFHAWSEKRPDKYKPDDTDERWSHYSTSPPSELSSGTLMKEMQAADPAAFQQLIANQWFVEPSVGEPLFPNDVSPAKPKKFTFEDFDQLADNALDDMGLPLIEGLLDQGAMSVLYGESNTGKTFVALDLAYHIATGRAWAGMACTQSAIVYVAAEGGRGFGKRVAGLKAKYGTPAPNFKVLRSPIDLLRPTADLAPLIAALQELGVPLGLIVIDTLSRAMAGGEENSSVDMGNMVKHLDAIRAATAAHLMTVHHSGKERAKGARGHSLLRAATDTEIEVADGAITATKQRDLERNFRTTFVLEAHVLGVSATGQPITSASIRLIEKQPAADGPGLSAEELTRRTKIAEAAYTALQGRSSATITSILAPLISELKLAGVTKAKTPQAIRSLISEALGGAGIEIVEDGQAVRMCAEKEGAGLKDAWIISTMKVPGSPTDILSEADASDASQDVLA